MRERQEREAADPQTRIGRARAAAGVQATGGSPTHHGHPDPQRSQESTGGFGRNHSLQVQITSPIAGGPLTSGYDSVGTYSMPSQATSQYDPRDEYSSGASASQQPGSQQPATTTAATVQSTSIASLADSSVERKRAMAAETRAALEQQIREKRERMEAERRALRDQVARPVSSSAPESVQSQSQPQSQLSPASNVGSASLQMSAQVPRQSAPQPPLPAATLPFTPFNPFAYPSPPLQYGFGVGMPLMGSPIGMYPLTGMPNPYDSLGAAAAAASGFRSHYSLATEGLFAQPALPVAIPVQPPGQYQASPGMAHVDSDDLSRSPASAQPPAQRGQPSQSQSYSSQQSGAQLSHSSTKQGAGYVPHVSANTSSEVLMDERKAAAQRYREELMQQMNESKRRKQRDEEYRKQEEAENAASLASYNPWGKGGAGAPFRDNTGRIVTNPKALTGKSTTTDDFIHSSAIDNNTQFQQHQQQQQQHPQSQTSSEGNNRSPPVIRGSLGSGNLYRDEREEKRLKHAAAQQQLKEQIEQQRRAKEEARRKKLEEELMEEARLAKERERLQERWERERAQEQAIALEKAAAKAGGASGAKRPGGGAEVTIAAPPPPSNHSNAHDDSQTQSSASTMPADLEIPPGMGESAKKKWLRLQQARLQREHDAAVGYVKPDYSSVVDDRPIGGAPRKPPQPQPQPQQPVPETSLHPQVSEPQAHLTQGQPNQPRQFSVAATAPDPYSSVAPSQSGMHPMASHMNPEFVPSRSEFSSGYPEMGNYYGGARPRPGSGMRPPSGYRPGSSLLQSAGRAMLFGESSGRGGADTLLDDLERQRIELRRRLQRVAEPEFSKPFDANPDDARLRSRDMHQPSFVHGDPEVAKGYGSGYGHGYSDNSFYPGVSHQQQQPWTNLGQPVNYSARKGYGILEQDSTFVGVSNDAEVDTLFGLPPSTSNQNAKDLNSASEQPHANRVPKLDLDPQFIEEQQKKSDLSVRGNDTNDQQLPSGKSSMIFPGKTPRGEVPTGPFRANLGSTASTDADTDMAVLERFLRRAQ